MLYNFRIKFWITKLDMQSFEAGDNKILEFLTTLQGLSIVKYKMGKGKPLAFAIEI